MTKLTPEKRGNNKSASQQQRHQLIQQIATKADINLLLLTATLHSSIEEAFLSLLGLLKPEFGQLSLDFLTEEQRKTLAQHSNYSIKTGAVTY